MGWRVWFWRTFFDVVMDEPTDGLVEEDNNLPQSMLESANDKCNYAPVIRVSEDRSHLNITRLDLTLRHLPEPNLRSSRNPSGICCFLCRWATGKKLSSQLLRCLDCNVSLCSWCYGLYHTTSVIDKNMKSWLANEIETRKNTTGQSEKKGKTTKKWCVCGYIVVCVVLKLSRKTIKMLQKTPNRLVPSTYSINLNVTSWKHIDHFLIQSLVAW